MLWLKILDFVAINVDILQLAFLPVLFVWGTQKFKDEETSKMHFWQKNVKSFYSGSYFLLKFLKHRWCTLKRSWPRRSGTNDIPQGFLTWFCSPAEKMLMLINCTWRSYNVQTFLHVVRISIFYYVFILFIRPPGCLTATSGFGIYEKSISFYTHEGYTTCDYLTVGGASLLPKCSNYLILFSHIVDSTS